MIQVKYFNIYEQDLETDINDWLRLNPQIGLIDIKFQLTTEKDFALIIYQIESKTELPVIPKEVADFIEKCKSAGANIWQFFIQVDVASKDYNEEWAKWALERADIIARAWLVGYQVGESK